jgi:DNA-binding SARP family transcriptional activator
MTQPIEINMLGGFSIRIGDKILKDDVGRSKQTWHLLQYLILNRMNNVSQEKLIDVLWGSEGCDNPTNSLKNLVYRIRKICTKTFPDNSCEMITYKRGTYSWNNTPECVIDIEEFEKAWKKTLQECLSDDEKIIFYQKAIDLYKGEFLPKSSTEEWVVFTSIHYSRIFIECVNGIVDILLPRKEFDRVIDICEKAIAIIPYDESLHKLLINTYLQSGERQKAMHYYEYVSNLFYVKLGIKLSEDLQDLTKNFADTMHDVETDLERIKSDLCETEAATCPYYCDYEIFLNLYRIQVRLSERLGQTVFIILLTLDINSKKVKSSEVVAGTMDILKTIIMKCLRKSDVISRFSNTQFILMLPSLTYENEKLVLDRILKKFYDENKNKSIFLNVKFSFDTQALKPQGSA